MELVIATTDFKLQMTESRVKVSLGSYTQYSIGRP